MTNLDLFPGATGPGAASADSPVSLGIQFDVTGPAWLVGYRFWRADTSIVGPLPARTYEVVDATTGTPVADSDATFTLAGTGWQEILLPAPVPLDQAPVAYRAAIHFPVAYSATGGYFTSGAGVGGITNGVLHAPDTTGAAGSDQCSFHYSGSLSYPDGGFNGGLYWLTPIVSDVDPSSGQVVVLDLAVETDTAAAVTVSRAVVLDQAVETDTAPALTPARAVLLGLAVETDTAAALTPARTVLLGLAVEVDTAHALVVLGPELVTRGSATAGSTRPTPGITPAPRRLPGMRGAP